jgi:predicted MFS family arabinose efflux permease
MGQTWLVYTLTNSPLLLGLLGAMQFLPITILSLFVGVIIDKYSKKKILIITQSISMILALILAALVFTHNLKYEYILILAILLGITNAIDMPTRQAFTVEIAGKEDLMNAIALNSAIFNLAKILGPAIGGIVMSFLGAGWCFLLNGLSFIAVIYSLLKISITPYVRKKKSNNMFKEISDGLRYIYKEKVLLETILLILVIGIFAFNYSVLVPVLTKNVLNKGEAGYGTLMAFLGIGSLFGALTVSIKNKSVPKVKIMIISSLMTAILLFLVGLSTNFYLSGIILCGTGIFNIYFSTTANTTLQINSKDEYRGRVMSVYALAFAGASPIGSLFAGVASSSIGVSKAFSLSGLSIVFFIVIISLLFAKGFKTNKM